MLGLFKKNKDNCLIIKAPIKGEVIDITDAPDAVFSQKIVGDGIAINPEEGRVLSPIEGEVVSLMPTGHAIGLRAKNGVEILIHIGIDTVEMQGEGFQKHVDEGDKIKPGQMLITFDLELVKKKAKSTISPVIITNMEEIKSIEKFHGEEELIMKVTI